MQADLLIRAQTKLNPEAIASYHSNGALYIPQALNADEVAYLRQGIEMNLANLSPRAKVASKTADTGLFVEDFCTWQANPYYQKIIFSSPLAEIARSLMDSETVRLYHDHLLVKEPFTRQITPWHQDQPYYNIDGKQNCSIWIPIDPVARESTLEFVAGSHLGPWYMPRTFMDNQAKWFTEGSLTELPTDEAIRQNQQILGWAMQPGDIVVFQMLTIHASAGVPINQRRRVFSVRFLGDDTRYAPRHWPTSPDFPTLNDELKPGAPMDHPLFPLIT